MSLQSPRVVAIIQARTNSTRLPGKALKPIYGKPMLDWVIERLKLSQKINKIMVATTLHPDDVAIENFCSSKNIAVFRGSEENVLDRYYQAAKRAEAQVVVRITSDCPLIDPQVVDYIVSEYLHRHQTQGDDYVSNCLIYTYPDGFDVEVFSFEALSKAWIEAHADFEKEHVTPYLIKSGKFKTSSVENPTPPSTHYRLTVDYPKDLLLMEQMFSTLVPKYGLNFGINEVIELLNRNEAMARMSTETISNEGYYRSLKKEPNVEAKAIKFTKSLQLKEEAAKLIPSLSQTFSKGPTQFVQGAAPAFLQKAKGSHVWDVDGNEYIDYSLGLGPIILGHNYERVSKAVVRQIEDGTTFSQPHPLEVEVSKLLTQIIPCAEMVRFGKNGSDVTAGAIRVSRAFTGKKHIANCGYHGWQDWCIGTTTRNLGVPKETSDLTHPFNYNDIDSLKKVLQDYKNDIAAIIMEPATSVDPKPGFLEEVRALATQHGAVLIFDEMVTGFRFGIGGAQEYYKVTPDLACFGKAIANGYPLAAVVGKAPIMKMFDDIFFSFTFGGETLSLVAARETIREMQEKPVFAHINEMGRRLMDGFNVLAKEMQLDHILRCYGFSCRNIIEFKGKTDEESLLMKSYFQQECIKRGILFVGYHNICFSTSRADVDHTLLVYKTAMELFQQALQKSDWSSRLEGTPVSAIFRKL